MADAAACVQLRPLYECSLADLHYEVLMLGSSGCSALMRHVADRYAALISDPPCTPEEKSRCAHILNAGDRVIVSSSNQQHWHSFLMSRGIRNEDHRAAIVQRLLELQQHGVRVNVHVSNSDVVSTSLPEQQHASSLSSAAEATAAAAAAAASQPLLPPSPPPPPPHYIMQQQHDVWPCDKITGILAALPLVPRIVLLSTGALNPIHLGHVHAMDRARTHLQQLGYNVIGGFISPTHDDYVRPKMEHQIAKGGAGATLGMVFAEGIHRRNMVAAACHSSDWLSAASWEIEQRSFEDFPFVTAALYRHLRQHNILRPSESGDDVMYVCGYDHWERCCRRGINTPSSRHAVVVLPRDGLVATSCDDNGKPMVIAVAAAADETTTTFSSTQVRQLIAQHQPEQAAAMMPKAAVDYLKKLNLYTQ